MRAPSLRPEVQRWSQTLAGFDGFMFVTAEYNHGVPAVLKNTLDLCYPEFNRKPAAFLGYGSVGGARSAEQLRLICIKLEMTPIRHAVHIGREAYGAVISGQKPSSTCPTCNTPPN